jgi:5-formyltetrahydrofolate cyclo-ligase
MRGAPLGQYVKDAACFACKSKVVRMSSLAEDKHALRKAVKETLKGLSQEQRAEQSKAICNRFIQSKFLSNSITTAAIYIHCPRLREVDTTPILQQALSLPECKVYAPRVEPDAPADMRFLHLKDMQSLEAVPPFGILEPTSVCATTGRPREDVLKQGKPLQLVVMPGLAFDRRGKRLGRGGGYYDTFIASCRARAAEQGWEPPLLIALAFREQIISGLIPCEEHDVPVDIVITPDEVLHCSKQMV